MKNSLIKILRHFVYLITKLYIEIPIQTALLICLSRLIPSTAISNVKIIS